MLHLHCSMETIHLKSGKYLKDLGLKLLHIFYTDMAQKCIQLIFFLSRFHKPSVHSTQYITFIYLTKIYILCAYITFVFTRIYKVHNVRLIDGLLMFADC